MRYLHKILESLQARADEARSSAFHRSAAVAKLSELQLVIAAHLFKLSHYPDHPARAGWLRELRAWGGQLRRMHKSKKGTGNYTHKALLKALWEEPLGEGDRVEIAAQLVNDGLSEVAINERLLRAYVDKYIADILNPKPGHQFTP